MAIETTKMVTLTIDGRQVTVPAGTLLIEAAKQIGVEVPHFCYHPKLKPDANCRMCLVEIEKLPKLQTACSTPVSEGMVVQASSTKVLEAREGVMEFILSSHPLDCPICDQGGECHLQDLAHEYSGQYSRFAEQKRTFEKEYFGPIIEKEMNRCIQCMRCVRYCDEVIDSNALKGLDRGNMTQPGTFLRSQLECEFCGGCIQICPVGALTSRVAMYDYRPWQLKKVETICPHCADGCMMKVESRDDKVMRITSEPGRGRNDGDLCARGFFGYQFINHNARLTQPLIRKSQDLVPISWFEAAREAAVRLAQVKARYGGKAIAGVITARCTNEDAFLFQKFMRLVLGSNHIDSTARLGHLNAVKSLGRVLGSARMMNSYEEIEKAELLFVLGADVTETNPILGLRVKKAVRQSGARLLTVNSFQENPGSYISNIVNRADSHLRTAPGSEGMAIRGLIKSVFSEGCYDPALQAKAPEYLTRLRQVSDALSYERIEKSTGLSQTQLRHAVGTLARAKNCVMLCGEDIVRGKNGYLNILNFCDLAILLGIMDRPGSGLNVLGHKSNAQGVVEMGVAPEYLPGLRSVSDPEAAAQFVSAWKDELLLAEGATLLEMMEKIKAGEIRALYLVGVDPLSLFPQSAGVREALEKLDLLIYQDLFLTPTGGFAHVVLPASSFAEKEGTLTNQEGRIQRIHRAIEPVGESRADWEIFSELAREMQYPLEYADASEIFSEMTNLVPFYHRRSARESRAEERRARIQDYLIRGYADDFEIRYATEREAANGMPDYPYTLVMGSSLFHSGGLSLQSDALMQIQPQGLIQMNPADAEALGLKKEQRVRLKSPHGSAEAAVSPNPKIPEKMLFFPEVFAREGLKELFAVELDAQTQVPFFRITKVRLEKF